MFAKRPQIFSRLVGVLLARFDKPKIWISECFSHGFLTLLDTAEQLNKPTDFVCRYATLPCLERIYDGS